MNTRSPPAGVVTQTIAAYVVDQGASALRFPARLDGNACVALLDQRGAVSTAGDQIAPIDQLPDGLTNVAGPWGRALEPTAP
ncbi:MAG: hypothetical protein QJR12_09720 [Mycobacterium sp.]|uniref:hypothetical protein n=1 Tax=Mycobacterium sp. TaxID=1785 RepID=UPI002602A949|nr:hypothetical protein [Mycobacterium sp.]MDI3314532.1 hypothetical protein [Mycobacterium sp.]